jgi:hypothetical protein
MTSSSADTSASGQQEVPSNRPSKKQYLRDTIGQRLGRYDRQLKKCAFVAGGLGAILVLMGLGGGIIDQAPHALKAWVVTISIVAGGLVGAAQINYTSSHSKLALKQNDYPVGVAAGLNAEDHHRYPVMASRLYNASVILLLIAGVLVIICAWWVPSTTKSGGGSNPAATSTPTPSVQPTPTATPPATTTPALPPSVAPTPPKPTVPTTPAR